MEKIQFNDLPSMTTPVSSANLNLMQSNMENAIIPIKLVTISTNPPSSSTTGDMYYNTTDNKVYTATNDNTWDNGSTPRYDGFYIDTTTQWMYYYNGATLIQCGGDISPDIKTQKTTSDLDVYSCNYINSVIQENTNYIKIGDLKICWGTGSTSYVNPNVLSGASSYPIEFNNSPVVQATILGTSNTRDDLDRNLKTTNVGTTGFQVYIHSANGEFASDWTQSYSWIAIGY